MPTDKLTDAAIRRLKPGAKPTKHFDGGGLYLHLAPSGARSWRMAYRDAAGKGQTLTFGLYPEVGLAEARKRRQEARERLRHGDTPARRTKPAMTLREASATYWRGRKDLSADYVRNAESAIEQHLFPALGDVPVNLIDRAALMAPLAAMDARGLHVYVRKTRMWVGQVLGWCVEHERAPINAAKLIDPRLAFGRRPVEHFPSVTLAEVPALLQRVDLEGDLTSALAFRLLALTWVRTAELRGMRWGEVDGDLWRVPGARMKRRRDHLVPLSRQATEVLRILQLRRRAKSDLVFGADHRDDRPISENAVLALLARCGYRGRMTGHGWRTIASTWANEAGHGADAIERQLAHAPDDRVRATYNHAAYLPERRVMLQAWADWLDRQRQGG